ncbi:uncharacterized protein LOC111242515 [Vigna radiata var. radiata]|uniref:Uncharacterized protein LOC111242515 n=1 Tax=Vigna radiata var. radiata TaxID=3916 RepID=A0A3Q0FDD2_VIGRR|nr:uncharacterized protein LOC111242515 [Vigna radiata var. radiata]
MEFLSNLAVYLKKQATLWESANVLNSHLQLEEVSEKSKALIPADSLRAPTQISESTSNVLPKGNYLFIPPQSEFHLSPTMVHGYFTETKDLATETSTVQKFDFASYNENKPTRWFWTIKTAW